MAECDQCAKLKSIIDELEKKVADLERRNSLKIQRIKDLEEQNSEYGWKLNPEGMGR